MVILKEIQIVGDLIKAKCYKEGMANREFNLSLNTKTLVPNVDIAMDSYVSHAIRRLRCILEDYRGGKSTLPAESKSMWY